MRAQAGLLNTHMAGMRAGLLKMNRPALARQVDAALLAMGEVGRSIDKVAHTKLSLLASQGRMAESLAQLKQVAARQAALGEQQVRSVTQRQADVSAAVDRRVGASLTLILCIALGRRACAQGTRGFDKLSPNGVESGGQERRLPAPPAPQSPAALPPPAPATARSRPPRPAPPTGAAWSAPRAGAAGAQ